MNGADDQTGQRSSRSAAHHASSTLWLSVVAAGAFVFYLPAYSPDLNPMEQAVAKLRALLREAAARTVEDLWLAIADSLDQLQPNEWANHVRNAGYGSNQSCNALVS
jgi:transposase